MASYGMIYTPRFMNSGTGVRAILRFFLRNLKDCNVGITDGLTKCAIEITSKWYDIHTKFHDDRFRHLSNIAVIAAKI
jgi:hypothetical protein